ncbi:PASTA domain-containing protein [candidate division KSB1 bacterium]|nr:PASTA domain-containing protein [candidate division KSB1 bacterium]
MDITTRFWDLIHWDKSKYIIIPLLSILIAYILVNDFIMPAYTRHGQEIEVPNTIEMTYEGARTLLQQNDLEIVEQAKKFDARFRSGIVISQNPHPYSKVKKGRRIYVIVSKGEPTLQMPRLIGSSEKNAVFEIEQLGLEVRYITYEHSEHFPNGVVIHQSIPIGEEVKVGKTIDLVVSLGQFPDKFIVPNVIGRSLKDARKIIRRSGLTFGSVSYQVNDDLLPETIIDQSLEPNTEVSQGDTLNLLVSTLGSGMEEEF